MEKTVEKTKHKLLALLLFCLDDVFVIFPWQIGHKGKWKDSQEVAC
jgi:hypothetical protein